MPYKWIMPALFYKYKGKKIYYTYHGAEVTSSNWFTTDPNEDDIDEVSEYHFDIRDLPSLIKDPVCDAICLKLQDDDDGRVNYLIREAIKRNLIKFPKKV